MLFGKAGFIRLRGMHLVTQISVIRPITETVTVFAAGIAGTVFIHTGQVSLNQRTQKKNWIGIKPNDLNITAKSSLDVERRWS